MVTRHLIAQIKAPAKALDNEDLIKESAVAACVSAGATVLSVHSHKFEPQGLTLIVILAESHFSVHTWPERCAAAVDLFTCGESTSPEEGINTFVTMIDGIIATKQSITRSV